MPNNQLEKAVNPDCSPLEEQLVLQRDTQITLWFARRGVCRKVQVLPEEATDKILEFAEMGYQLSHGKRETRIFVY